MRRTWNAIAKKEPVETYSEVVRNDASVRSYNYPVYQQQKKKSGKGLIAVMLSAIFITGVLGTAAVTVHQLDIGQDTEQQVAEVPETISITADLVEPYRAETRDEMTITTDTVEPEPEKSTPEPTPVVEEVPEATPELEIKVEEDPVTPEPEITEEQPVQEIPETEPANFTLEINFDEVSPEMQDLYYEYLSYEPAQVLTAIALNQIPINVAPSDKYTEGSAGLYKTNFCSRRSININCSTENRLKISVNHEIGHCVDELIGQAWGIPYSQPAYQPQACVFISNSDEFQQIYAEECSGAGYPSCNSTCAAEYFAETYRYVVEGNQVMMERAPRATEFVKRVINEAFGTAY